MTKKIQLKQFGEQVIAWINSNEFLKARLKITGYYLVVIFILLNIFVVVLSVVLEKEAKDYQKNIDIYFNQKKSIYIEENGLTIISMQPQIFSFNSGDLISEHKIFINVIQKDLIKIELVLLILGAVLSYFLAGLSLKPIEEKNKKTKKFLADVAHELKNPLSALKMSLEIHQKQKEWRLGETQEVFKDLEEEVNRLIKITDDLLLLERKTILKSKRVNIKNVLEEVIKKLEGFSQENNIQVILQNEDYFFQTDPDDLEKIIFNIIHNAIKFSKQNGKIEITLQVDGKLIIKDYGIGIENSQIKEIFNRFYKIDEARVLGKNNGSGLGLAIVKDLAEKNNIKIKVKSKKNKFTKFILLFD